ncbi:hypothetical protein [Simplicispira metamorpha]|nr:hypothetical protein [Simplicispira metamorpha]
MHHTPIYVHPEGHEITVGQGLITACTAEGIALSMPIGPDGLAALGAALLEHATTAAQEESERAGAALGTDLSSELFALRGRPQAETFRAVNEALRALVKLEHPDSAAGGFAAAIVNVLELGIANLPKFDGEAAE